VAHLIDMVDITTGWHPLHTCATAVRVTTGPFLQLGGVSSAVINRRVALSTNGIHELSKKSGVGSLVLDIRVASRGSSWWVAILWTTRLFRVYCAGQNPGQVKHEAPGAQSSGNSVAPKRMSPAIERLAPAPPVTRSAGP
jgi:hypothetical protein